MKYKKLFLISLVSLCFVNMISIMNPQTIAKENTTDQAMLEIEFVSSGFNVDYKISELFGVSAVIINTGQVSATNVQWSISLSGGIVIGKKASGTI